MLAVHVDDDRRSRDGIVAALLALSPPKSAALTRTLAAESALRLRRLATILLSPSRFLLLLRHIDSLPFPSKTLLIARLHLRSLHLLSSICPLWGLSHPDEFDAALLLLALCRVTAAGGGAAILAGADWRHVVSDHLASHSLLFSGLGDPGGIAVTTFVDEAMDCRRFLQSIMQENNTSTAPSSAPAAEYVVKSLTVIAGGAPAVAGAREECVICREEVAGDGTCEMPCSHVFHLACVRTWLKTVNTCPTCRFELPTDNVLFEIERLWRVLMAKGRSWPSVGEDGR